MANGRQGKTFPKYQCARQPGYPNCGKLAIDERRADEFVSGMVLAHIRESAGVGSGALDEAEASRLRGLRADDHAALIELSRDRYLRRIIDERTFFQTKESLEERIQDSEAQLAHLTRRSQLDFGMDIAEWWASASIEDKRRVLRLFVERVVIAPVGKGGRVFRPERIEILWAA